MSLFRYTVVVAIVASSFVPAGSVFAQQNGPDGHVESGMRLNVEVTAPKGRPTPELSEKNFTVLDNHSERQITSFAAVQGKDAPVEVVIVIDAVNTPFTYLAYQRDQMVKYLRSNDGVLPYPTTFAVVTDQNIEMYRGVSKDGNALATALSKKDIGLRVINRAQGFYGAGDRMTVSLNALRSLTAAEEKRPGRKLVLWVSPGWPLLSGPEVDLDPNQRNAIYANAVAFSRELRNADITLYDINSWGVSESMSHEYFYKNFLTGLKGPDKAQWGDVSLQVLAEQSGGLVLNSNDVKGMMKQCVDDANEYYRLTLAPEPADGPNTYHQIEVKVAEGGLVARTRKGYYAQP
jgi:VWFA-related protein